MSYLIRRAATLFITLFLVSLFTFLAFNAIPGDPVSLILGTSATPGQTELLKTQLGLDKSLAVRYGEWLSGFIRGDFGNSIKYSVPVKSLLTGRLSVTVWLALLSVALIAVISVPVGIYSAKKRGTAADRIINALTLINLSIPHFFLGVMFILFFGIMLKFFTPGNYVDYRTDFPGFLRFMMFPALAIALPNIAVVVKFLRASAIGEMKADYVRTAFSKGNSDNAVLYRHVLKNALVPVITLLGMIVAEVFSGSIIIEQVFGLPGLGQLLITSISYRDFPLIETMVVYIALIVVAANFLVDVLLQFIDPRIRVR